MKSLTSWPSLSRMIYKDLLLHGVWNKKWIRKFLKSIDLERRSFRKLFTLPLDLADFVTVWFWRIEISKWAYGESCCEGQTILFLLIWIMRYKYNKLNENFIILKYGSAVRFLPMSLGWWIYLPLSPKQASWMENKAMLNSLCVVSSLVVTSFNLFMIEENWRWSQQTYV